MKNGEKMVSRQLENALAKLFPSRAATSGIEPLQGRAHFH
jgi:hypothetical protein